MGLLDEIELYESHPGKQRSSQGSTKRFQSRDGRASSSQESFSAAPENFPIFCESQP